MQSRASILGKLFKETAIYGIGGIAARLLNFLLVPYYTSQLLPADYGVVIEIYALIAVFSSLLSLGMETTFFRFVQSFPFQKVLYTAYAILLFISLISLLSGIFLIPWLSQWMGYTTNPAYLYLALSIVFIDNMLVIPLACLRYRGKALRYVGVKLLNVLSFISLNIFFLTGLPRLKGIEVWQTLYVESWGPGYIFSANLIASGLSLIFLIGGTPILYRWHLLSISLGKQMIRYSFPIVVAAFAAIIHQTADKFFLKYLLPKEIQSYNLGVYGACAKLAVFITLFTQAFRLAAEPFFFSKIKDGHAKELYAMTMNYLVLVLGFIYVVLCCNLSWIKGFISQPVYWEGLDIVPILLMSNFFLAVYVNLSIWYKVADKTKYGAYISSLGVFVIIFANLLLTPKFSYLGAAFSTLATYGVMMVVSYALNQRKNPIPYYRKRFVLYVSLAMLLGGSGYFFLVDKLWVQFVFPLVFLLLAGLIEKSSKSGVSTLSSIH